MFQVVFYGIIFIVANILQSGTLGLSGLLVALHVEMARKREKEHAVLAIQKIAMAKRLKLQIAMNEIALVGLYHCDLFLIGVQNKKTDWK